MSVGPLRIATFNVQHGRRPDGVVDVGALAESVADLGADLVGLQEVDQGAGRSGGADIADRVAAVAGMAFVFRPSLVLRDGGRYGNALLARGTIDDVDVVELPRRPDGRRAEPRTLLLARVALPGGPVTFGSCHLGLDRREARVQLAAALAAASSRPGPRAVVGDWNLARRHAQPLAASAGFSLAPAGPTFPAAGVAWRRIDHVALDGLVARGSTVLRLPVSDHRALVVDCHR